MRGRRWLERGLLVAGLIAINVWIWSNAITVISQKYDSLVFDRLRNAPITKTHPMLPEMRPTRRALLGRLTIPRLHLTAMVREGDDAETLELALGHIPSSALPGQPGNVCLAGHRDTLLRPLRNIRKDDVIELETSRGSFTYQVESTRIVNPRDVEVLAAGGHPELTLVTCYPFSYIGSAPDRFIVKARQVPGTVARAIGG